MNNRRKMLVTVLAVFTMALLIFGTAAFFNDTFYVTNVITTGGVDISLIEDFNGKTKEFNGNTIAENKVEYTDSIMPGADIEKTVKVKNTGKSTAYVRISIKKDVETENAEYKESNASVVNDLVKFKFEDKGEYNTDDWEYSDGYYYYKNPLESGQTTSPLFKNVIFSKEMTNSFQNSKVEIIVTAEATQKDNNGESAVDAKGWPDSNVDYDE